MISAACGAFFHPKYCNSADAQTGGQCCKPCHVFVLVLLQRFQPGPS